MIRLGTSGWSYEGWRGVFYPPDLSRKRELEFASRAFNSLEINRSFYSLLTPASCRAWYDATPADFLFAIKGSSFITHSKKLRDVDVALANFFASGPLALADKIGPIVWQLPKSMRFDADQLSAFFERVPRTLKEAAKVGRHHDHRPKHGTFLEVTRDRPLLHVLEPRHDTFLNAECARLLRRLDVALSVTDSPDWSYAEEPTTNFMYVRLHGSTALYSSSYSDEELDHWAQRVRSWHEGREPPNARRISKAPPRRRAMDVYVYFDNDAAGHAIANARGLQQRLSSAQSLRKGA
jgi:uncharacterized protein YecE (DUF72 family)